MTEAHDRETGETRWLDTDERAAWLATAAIMITLPAALDSRLQREAGLTFFEYLVLSVLSEQDDRTMQMSEIAAGVSASLSRLSHAIKKLEEKHLVTRSRVPGTGRRTAATLTDAGYERVVAAAPGHVAAVREYLMDALEPDDLATLRRIGVATATRINPDRPFLHGNPGS
ncbi:MarR family winged helix-turn-helix transcriptional regulator [Glaciibacter superstes]|uniref:MarR family winged helix-turn-helix transcriptional regulator n=1 Tax=Glaciibacter superstes TaxID=501023 RepID=UPI0003B47CE0|nr:MarR family winged helix-turn-helix transcriptional regulator [Glaciibacter superstes]